MIVACVTTACRNRMAAFHHALSIAVSTHRLPLTRHIVDSGVPKCQVTCLYPQTPHLWYLGPQEIPRHSDLWLAMDPLSLLSPPASSKELHTGIQLCEECRGVTLVVELPGFVPNLADLDPLDEFITSTILNPLLTLKDSKFSRFGVLTCFRPTFQQHWMTNNCQEKRFGGTKPCLMGDTAIPSQSIVLSNRYRDCLVFNVAASNHYTGHQSPDWPYNYIAPLIGCEVMIATHHIVNTLSEPWSIFAILLKVIDFPIWLRTIHLIPFGT